MIHKHLWRQYLASFATASLLAAFSHVCHAQMIVAHRGASEIAPENTLSAFKLAWKLGADAIEGDFYLTCDRHIVTIHDDNTQRTAGVDRKVVDSTLEQLKQLDVGSWKSSTYRGERIPTLEEVLDTVPEGKKIFIEIKCGPEIVPLLRESLTNSHLAPAQTSVISFQEDVIRDVKRQIPTIKAYWLIGYKQDEETKRWSPTLAEILATLRRTGADGLDTQANRDVVGETFVKAIRSAGYELHTWTIDEPADARHFQQLGVDSITTNRPRLIRETLTQADRR